MKNKNHDELEQENTEEVVFEETNAEGDELATKDKLKQLRSELAAEKEKSKEYLDGWQRARADLVNKDKQLAQDRMEMMKRAGERFAEAVLPTLDGYEMARRNKEAWEAVDAKWRVGIEYLFGQLQSAFEAEGLEKIEPKEGEAFNVAKMSSTEEVETDDESKDHTVAEVVQAGFAFNGRILRDAKVKVFVKK
jgi:molecular chaperone GrpE